MIIGFRALMTKCLGAFKRTSPIKTGNLRFNATKSENAVYFGVKVYKIYIEDEIAPYVYYTNEPWISPRWHGKKNPNEGWIDRGVMEVCQVIANELGGKVIESD